MAGDMDSVFKALADPTRRRLLDHLRAEDGQTLGRLCARLDMTRQSVTQHLGVLEEATLISTVRRGREKLHYLNPVPIHDVQQRWIAPFEEPRLRALDAIRRQAEGVGIADADAIRRRVEGAGTAGVDGVRSRAVGAGAGEFGEGRGSVERAGPVGAGRIRISAEEQSMKPDYVYVTYIHATPERVWEALTSADLTGDYWGHRNVSDWEPGSSWEHVRTDGSGVADAGGVVLEAEPPRRLVMTFGEAGSGDGPEASKVTFVIEQHHDIVRLTLTHINLQSDDDLKAISFGWPAVMANLKSLLETGHVLPQAPWEVPADQPAG